MYWKFQIDGLKVVTGYMFYISNVKLDKHRSSADHVACPKLQSEARLLKVVENLVKVKSEILLSEEIKDPLIKVLIQSLDKDTSGTEYVRLYEFIHISKHSLTCQITIECLMH